MKSNWLKRFSMQLSPNLFFPSIKQFCHELLPKLVEKTKQLYVLPTLTKLWFCNKLWFVDVKSYTWCFCIGDQYFSKCWLATKTYFP